MIHRVTEDTVVAASSGIVSDPDSWWPVPNHVVLGVDLGTRRTTVAHLKDYGLSRSE